MFGKKNNNYSAQLFKLLVAPLKKKKEWKYVRELF